MVGETPNLAARLQALAEPGTVVITAGDAAPGRRPVRARRSRPAAAQGLRRAGARPGGSSARAAPRAASRRPRRGLTPLVGREQELGAAARPLGAGQGRRRARWCCSPASPASASRGWCARCASGLARRAAHAAQPLLLALSHQTARSTRSSSQLERAARLAPRRPARGAARQARGAARARRRDRLDEAVPLLAALLSIPTGERYPRPTLTPQRAEAADVRGAARPARGPRRRSSRCWRCSRTCTGSTRRRSSCSTCVIERVAAPAGAGARHLPARVPAALAGQRARHRADR